MFSFQFALKKTLRGKKSEWTDGIQTPGQWCQKWPHQRPLICYLFRLAFMHRKDQFSVHIKRAIKSIKVFISKKSLKWNFKMHWNVVSPWGNFSPPKSEYKRKIEIEWFRIKEFEKKSIYRLCGSERTFYKTKNDLEKWNSTIEMNTNT